MSEGELEKEAEIYANGSWRAKDNYIAGAKAERERIYKELMKLKEEYRSFGFGKAILSTQEIIELCKQDYESQARKEKGKDGNG